ncbi:hypothetical protein BDY19DRAFT_394379 [Irpex rosettiformis]|uniref:Uncharacterized protein n=1 Tax=Irpex rosettiformis TaxID=378272 RepID=A0ACB8TV27_9APHY|nr:hypothetical protein BDY19DRAFT_394379 [Irpex rosettiformis]
METDTCLHAERNLYWNKVVVADTAVDEMSAHRQTPTVTKGEGIGNSAICQVRPYGARSFGHLRPLYIVRVVILQVVRVIGDWWVYIFFSNSRTLAALRVSTFSFPRFQSSNPYSHPAGLTATTGSPRVKLCNRTIRALRSKLCQNLVRLAS